MSSVLSTLEPNLVWNHFDQIRQIPRPSKHEERIVRHVLDWAGARGFETRQDEVGNIVVKVPAREGLEKAPSTVLQSHLDMVCEKNSDVEHDFMKDPIQVEVDGDWVKSVGTTLGSDNGLGVACAMAVADDPDLVHGPLELLFTLDEETGLTGAADLDGSMVQGRILLNLDSEEDGVIYIGCAGGADSRAVFSVSRVSPRKGDLPFRLSVTGLRGGHSGGDIHENRANAIKLLARALGRGFAEGLDPSVFSLQGGSKTNAIPREAFAELGLNPARRDEFAALVERIADEARVEFGSIEPGLDLKLAPIEGEPEFSSPVGTEDAQRILRVLNGLPQGVLAMSREVDGLVETSNNVAVLETTNGEFQLITSHRSSVMPALLDVQNMVRSTCELGGADVTIHDAYPGWKPDPNSSIVQRTSTTFESLFGKPPAIRAIHAGLECGLLLEKIPGMDAVSIGPEIRNAHSPDEMAQISSTARFYRHLSALLASIAQNS